MKLTTRLKILPIILIWSFSFAMVVSWVLVAITHPVTLPRIHSMILEKSIVDVDEQPGIVVFIETADDGLIGHIFEQGTVFGSGLIELYRHRSFAYEDSYLTTAHGREQLFGVAFAEYSVRFTHGTPYPWYTRQLVWLPFSVAVLVFVITFKIVNRYFKTREHTS